MSEDSPYSNILDYGPGMLTLAQREYLAGTSQVEPQSAHERTIRSRIRKRIRNGIRDFVGANRELSPRDKRLITYDFKSRDHRVSREESLVSDFGEIVQLSLELALRYSDLEPDSIEKRQENPEYKRDVNLDEDVYLEVAEILENAITHASVRSGRVVGDCNIDISITIEGDLSELAEQPIESVDTDKLHQLARSGEISQEEYLRELGSRDGVNPAHAVTEKKIRDEFDLE